MIPFTSIPVQTTIPFQPEWKGSKNQFIDNEILSLINKGVIIRSAHEHGEFISPIFLCDKRDGSFRMILNLKTLNRYVEYNHFKMETIWTAVSMMKPGCYMATIDIKDTYYCVPINKVHQKYLKFKWKGTLYQFTCYPNGLACCPRKFTKLMKPVYCTLREAGHLSVGYIDDSYLQGNDYDQCLENIKATVTLFNTLGVVTHPVKSVLEPTQQITFLGFQLNSLTMTISLTPEKAVKVKDACQNLLTNASPTIREVSQVLGLLTSSMPGVMYGPLHYRWLDIDKSQALHLHKGNFDKTIMLSPCAKADLKWWTESIESAYNVISHGEPALTLATDASKTGWGCTTLGTPTGGHWTPEEASNHINYLEIKAVLLGLQSFVKVVSDKHFKVLVDNTTAVSCINQMGTCHSQDLNCLVISIWEWCINHNVWLTVAHIPGTDNVIADRESRKSRSDTEWALDSHIFYKPVQECGFTPDVDLFASRLNNKCRKYISYRPDPGAQAVNAFTIPWGNLQFYAFPPFSIILKVLRKVNSEIATGLIVVPHWPTQSWWPYLTDMLIAKPIILPRKPDLLYLPSEPQRIHPLSKTMRLIPFQQL